MRHKITLVILEPHCLVIITRNISLVVVTGDIDVILYVYLFKNIWKVKAIQHKNQTEKTVIFLENGFMVLSPCSLSHDFDHDGGVG